MPEDSDQTDNSEQNPGQDSNSEQADAQPSSQPATFSEEQIQQIGEIARRTVQAKEDRATSRVEKRQDALEDQMKRFYDLIKEGKTFDEAQDRMLLDQLRAERQGASSSQAVEQTNSTPAGQTQKADFTAIYTALDLDPNDPDVIRATAQHVNDIAGLKTALTDIKIKKVSGQGASAGSVSQPSGGGSPNAIANVESLRKEVERLSNEPMASKKDLKEAKAKLQKAMLGLS